MAGNALMSLFSPHQSASAVDSVVAALAVLRPAARGRPGRARTTSTPEAGARVAAHPGGNQDYVDNGTWDQQSGTSDSSWVDNSGGGSDSSWDSGGGSSDDTF